MSYKVFLLVFLMPSLIYGASEHCSTSVILTQIRPGAAWTMQGDAMGKLNWLDKKQKKPTIAEVQKAKAVCEEDVKNRYALKAQARLEVKDPSVPVEKKLNDLILLLDFDR